MFNIIFADTNKGIVEEMEKLKHKYGMDSIKTYNLPFQEVCHIERIDALVSPANSFAIMDGGVDYHIREFCNTDIENNIRERSPIIPVGTCVTELTYNPLIPLLISAPTMTIPMDISRTINGYLATRAALGEFEIEFYPYGLESHTILFMGMGGLTGGYSPNQCARQMLKAMEDYKNNSKYETWEEVKGLYLSCGVII